MTRLYLIAPPELSADTLGAVLDAADVGCVLLARADAATIARLLPVVRGRDLACLGESVELVLAHDLDGVHLADPSGYADARERLGDRSVGVYCGDSRHIGMEWAEAGADYVALDPDPEVIAWWAAVMTVPVVAWKAPLDQLAALTALDCDFVTVEEEAARFDQLAAALSSVGGGA